MRQNGHFLSLRQAHAAANKLFGRGCQLRNTIGARTGMGETSLRDAGAAFGISTRWVQSTIDERDGPRRPAMPPNEQCPNCYRLVADWHVEWYKTEGPSLYQGLAALDCPLVSATCRVSRRKDRAGTARCAPHNAARGPGRSVGRISGDFGGRNVARLYVCGWGRGPVRSLLDPARSPASGRAPTSETRRTVR